MKKNLTLYRVIYGDTDQMGVAYYANYLKWFEIGRTELLRQIGVPYASIEEKGLRFPVTEVSCRYFRSSRYDDVITIETALTSLGRVTLTFSYRLLRKEDGVLIASGWTKHACVDEKGEVTRIPVELEATLKSAVSGKE
ncbi:MAG: acyl-CoA thioesterase [Deltaproteobacteria bacterium]|nr:acyl-CoA thioesterase [Deltaproteobacteria bacterium]